MVFIQEKEVNKMAVFEKDATVEQKKNRAIFGAPAAALFSYFVRRSPRTKKEKQEYLRTSFLIGTTVLGFLYPKE